jgi:hypothetical protein
LEHTGYHTNVHEMVQIAIMVFQVARVRSPAYSDGVGGLRFGSEGLLRFVWTWLVACCSTECALCCESFSFVVVEGALQAHGSIWSR